jgi:recombination protein RecR
MQLPSKYLEILVSEFARFPGIGKKTALRMALYLIKQPREMMDEFGKNISAIATHLNFCKECGNVSDSELCEICANTQRDNEVLCVVEDLRDVIAIENTMQYKGKYHILGGLISPMDGIGPENLNLEKIRERIIAHQVKEILIALSATVEGETTLYYISKLLKNEFQNLRISTLSRGIAVGGELEYADEITLGRSIINRIAYDV